MFAWFSVHSHYAFIPQALVSFQKYMAPTLPYFKVNICPFPLPHFASTFFAYLWSFRWSNYIVTLPRYFSFRLPHLNILTGHPSDELDKNIPPTSLGLLFSHTCILCPQFFDWHRIHVLFMMYDVYWYCQLKKNEWLWKFWKKGRGGNEIHAPCACALKCKVSLWNTDNCSNADYKNMFNSKLLTFDF